MPAALRATIVLAILGQVFVVLGVAGALTPIWTAAAFAAALFAAAPAAARAAAGRAATCVAAVQIVLLILLALYPPVAFDETLYHLPFIRAIARTGAIAFHPDIRFGIFPQLHEVLCVPAFLAFGDVATHFVALIELLLLAGIVWKWGGPLAAALVVGNPIVFHLATITYDEMALALFVTAGFFCLDREKPAAAGLLFAAACSVKYLGWYFAVAALIVALYRRRPIFLATFIAGILPMYATIFAYRGFENLSQWTTHRVVVPWRVLWDITFARDRVNQQPPYSPLFAISMLIVFFRSRWLAILCLGYLACFAFLPQDSRYLLPLLPLVSVAVAKMEFPWKNAIAIASIAIGIAYAGYRIARWGFPPLSAEARREFQRQHIPELRALGARGPGRIWVCGAEQLKYFGGDDLYGDVTGPWSPERVNLRTFDYVLVSRRQCPSMQNLPFEVVYADAGATLWRVAPR